MNNATPMNVTADRPVMKRPGFVFFALTMIGIGIFGLIKGAFTPTWSGVPKAFPARVALAYLCAFVCVASGIGLLWRRTAGIAARVLVGTFSIWTVVFRLPGIFESPTATDPWWALADTAVMMAASLVLYAWFAAAADRRRFGFALSDKAVPIARVLFGLGLIPFGVAHFTYFQHTVDMVPSWLPWHVALASVTGGGFIAAGIAVIVGVYARLAAALVTLQLAEFTLLVWVPVVIAHPSASDWAEFVSSWVLTAAAWVVAESFTDSPSPRVR
jgi:uncharacterized membrane protein